jgi:succinate dehydrogenase / fumarate reductase, cytochrome b subunit
MTARALTFYGSTIGKKVVMAITGLIGFGFIVGHMTGHLIAFKGALPYNQYAHFLKSTLPLLWGTRITLLVAIALHVHCVLSLWARNNEARPRSYYQRKDLATNYAALTMRYGGLFLLFFILYHLAQFTWGVAPLAEAITGGVPYDPYNPYNNMIIGFQNPLIAGFYILAMLALGMHLYHGIWSLTQTLGAEHPKYNGLRKQASIVGTLIVVLGFLTVPISVLTGVLEPVEPGTNEAEEPG